MTNQEFKDALAAKAGVIRQVPVGRSFEVHGANPEQAVANAVIKAGRGSIEIGHVLHIGQIEAGKWEVVFVDPNETPIPDAN